MRIQELEYSCGAAAIRNALCCFGKLFTEEQIRQAAGTHENGTDEDGVVSALKFLGFSSEQFETKKNEIARRKLLENLDDGSPVMLAVDRDTHWLSVVGRIGDRFLIFDSQQEPRNLRENGVQVLTFRGLLRRWKKKNGAMYGIVIQKKK
jgi:ABC-type bacteriocin/lantibiotic exporter with double-glycine peptidase domain